MRALLFGPVVRRWFCTVLFCGDGLFWHAVWYCIVVSYFAFNDDGSGGNGGGSGGGRSRRNGLGKFYLLAFIIFPSLSLLVDGRRWYYMCGLVDAAICFYVVVVLFGRKVGSNTLLLYCCAVVPHARQKPSG